MLGLQEGSDSSIVSVLDCCQGMAVFEVFRVSLQPIVSRFLELLTDIDRLSILQLLNFLQSKKQHIDRCMEVGSLLR